MGWGLQTGQYSTQIFSLAVLLSSLFVYNQMGGIDEAALDRLSLVTEMTKHIRVKAASGVTLTFLQLQVLVPPMQQLPLHCQCGLLCQHPAEKRSLQATRYT